MIVYKHGQPFLFLGASWDLISSGLVTQMPRSNSTIYFHADVFLKMLNWNVCVCCVYVGRGGAPMCISWTFVIVTNKNYNCKLTKGMVISKRYVHNHLDIGSIDYYTKL